MKQPIQLGGIHEGAKIRLDLGIHYNDGLELVYIRKGQALWTVEDRSIPVQAGDLFFTLPWEKHGGVQQVQWGLHLDWAVIDVGEQCGELQQPPGLSFPKAQWDSLRDTLLHATLRCLPVPAEIGNLLQQVVRLYSSASERDHLKVSHLLSLLLLEIEDELQKAVPQQQNSQAGPEQRVMDWVQRAAEWIERSASLDQMAADCGLKRSRFSALVKSISGDSPIIYLNRVRIMKACDLLEQGKQSITEIAFECGFESSQYFARCFRSFLDCSPSEYRERAGQPSFWDQVSS